MSNNTDKDIFKEVRRIAYGVVVLLLVIFLSWPAAQVVMILWQY